VALDGIDRMRELGEGRGDQHLALFLEGAHAAAISLGRAADQDHRPAILLGIGKAGEAVDDTRVGGNSEQHRLYAERQGSSRYCSAQPS
jgi:hypothetical protein